MLRTNWRLFAKRMIVLLLASASAATANAADDAQHPFDSVQITATREPEPIDQVPASISVVSGDELRNRGANDLRTALSLLSGVEGTAGGDNGPAGAVARVVGVA
jgi:outer membrane receptor for ferrienterochelin and colicin